MRVGSRRDRPGCPHVPVGVAVSARSARSAAPASLLVFAGIVSVQLGAGLAARLFSEAGPAGVTGLRLWWAALIMAVFGGRAVARAVRSAVAERAWRDLGIAVAFGVVLGAMNFSIYQSFARIPLGVAVTIEFLGPLAVAVASSRRLLDLAWVVLAAAGVLLLTQGGAELASGASHGASGVASHAGPLLGLSTAATGIGFGLVAAACWAAYILLSRATGRRFSDSSGLVIAMIVAAALVSWPAVTQAGPALGRPSVIAEGLAVGLLSSVIPYRVELEALRRVPAGVFGIWMSLEPAVAALIGLVLLSETLIVRQWLAIAAVIIASAGAARSSAGASKPLPELPPPPAS
jgi:inner membrane transporter RhtA